MVFNMSPCTALLLVPTRVESDVYSVILSGYRFCQVTSQTGRSVNTSSLLLCTQHMIDLHRAAAVYLFHA